MSVTNTRQHIGDWIRHYHVLKVHPFRHTSIHHHHANFLIEKPYFYWPIFPNRPCHPMLRCERSVLFDHMSTRMPSLRRGFRPDVPTCGNTPGTNQIAAYTIGVAHRRDSDLQYVLS